MRRRLGPTRWSTRSPGSSSASATAPSPGVAAHPALANVVVVGGDDIIPMARLDDTTRVGNETGYADEFDVNGPTTARSAPATSSATTRTEISIRSSGRPGGCTCPSWRSAASSRRPTQIIAQLDAFAGASGRLDASRAYAAGYDFMTDGARSVRAELEQSLTTANGATAVVSGPTNESTWSGSELLADLAGPPAPSIAAVFGHFDHTALETPEGDGVTAAELAETLPAGARLVFSMGCHSGLAVSDATVGGGPRAADLPAALTGARCRVPGGHWLRVRRPGQRRPPGTADDVVRRRARRRGVGRGRPAQRQAELLRRPGPVRRVRREGVVEHDPVRPADVRRRRRASRSSDAAQRHDRPDEHARPVSRALRRGVRLRPPDRRHRCLVRGRCRHRSAAPADHRQPAGAAPRRARRHRDGRRRLAAARARRGGDRAATPGRRNRTSTPRSAARRSTTQPANPKPSTPSPPSRPGWRTSPRRATPRVRSVPTASPNGRSSC